MQLKILIVGCGSIGRRHARSLRGLGVSDLLLFDVAEERAERLADEVKAMYLETIDQAFAEKPDAVVICTPTSRHLETAFESVMHGCDLFVEKPLSHSMEGVEALIEAAESRGKILQVGYTFRFDRVVRKIRAALKEQRIGRVTSARIQSGSYLPWRHPWEDYRSGYGAQRELGGGVILDAVHELDLAQWFFGRPETVYCAGGKLSELEIDVEDSAEIIFCYRQSVVSLHLDYIQQPAGRTCEIIGVNGQITADLFARELSLFDGITRQRELDREIGSIDEMYLLEMRHFLDCIEKRSAPIVDGQAAAESLLLAEAAKESMCSGMPVQFDEFARSRMISTRPAHA